MGICEGRYSLCRTGDRCDHSLLDHFIESVLYVLPVLNGNLPLGMLHGGNTRVGSDGKGPGHILYGIKESLEGPLQGNYVLGPLLWSKGKSPWSTSP